MIQELVEFGKRVTNGMNRALKEEFFSIVLVIDEHGAFQRFIVGDKQPIMAETITAKKGKARFLLDKCEEVLDAGEENSHKKHQLFINKLQLYQSVPILEPVFKFYNENKKNGIEKAKEDFKKLDAKSQTNNITFMVGTTLLLNTEEIKNAIIKQFEEEEQKRVNGKICSICGTSTIPVLDEPHGMVKMPKGQTAGCALVSYNETAFESYGLKGNLNSSICRECAKNYIEGLNFLLSDGYVVEGKKNHFHYNHRVKISDTTLALFWTKEETKEMNPFIIYDESNEAEIKNLFESVWNGDSKIGTIVDSNMFYSCTLSSASARIAVRDWTAISLDDYKHNLADWFHDIEIEDKNGKLTYNPLGLLINATQRDKNYGERSKSDMNSKAKIGSILWNAAIKGRLYKIPIEILQYVLNRICMGDEFTEHRAAVIRLIINRNTDKNMNSSLDETNRSIAYLCGRLFAVIESMQLKAIGKVNSGIKERYFTAAVSQPGYILATLLTKNVPIYQHKIGGYLAKELNEIAGIISEKGSFPQHFSSIEQGEFALGYYFQRTHKNKNEKSENTNV